MVGSFGSQLQDRGDISAPDQPQKSDEFVVIVGTDKIAGVCKSSMIALNLGEGFSVVPVPPSLAHRTLVLDLEDSVYQFIIIRTIYDENATFL